MIKRIPVSRDEVLFCPTAFHIYSPVEQICSTKVISVAVHSGPRASKAKQFLNKGAFIVSGCYVSWSSTGATITAGIVLVDGQLLRFAGQSNVSLPPQLQAGKVVLSDPRPYQTGGTKNRMREVCLDLVQ